MLPLHRIDHHLILRASRKKVVISYESPNPRVDGMPSMDWDEISWGACKPARTTNQKKLCIYSMQSTNGSNNIMILQDLLKIYLPKKKSHTKPEKSPQMMHICIGRHCGPFLGCLSYYKLLKLLWLFFTPSWSYLLATSLNIIWDQIVCPAKNIYNKW